LVGIASYGHNYVVEGSPPYPVGTPDTGAGDAGACTESPGTLAYYEIESLLALPMVSVFVDTTAQAPYAYTATGSDWVGYDNPASLAIKANYVKDNSLGGVVVWTLDLDDFSSGYPLITAISTAFHTTSNTSMATSSSKATIGSSSSGTTSKQTTSAVSSTSGGKIPTTTTTQGTILSDASLSVQRQFLLFALVVSFVLAVQ